MKTSLKALMKALWWSLRRELWEHGWVYRVPALIGAIVISVFLGVAGVHVASLEGAAGSDRWLVTGSFLSHVFDLATRMILITGTVTAYVYCAEALNGERRDRAILFWKSWPVGDGATVTAKAMVPLIVVPLLTLALLFVAQLAAGLVLIGGRAPVLDAPMANPGAATLEVIAATLWIAPVHAWIMLVSAWARRAVLLLAFLPPVVVATVGRMVGRGADVGNGLFSRGVGRHWPVELSAGAVPSASMVGRPAPELLGSASLWIGLGLAALLLALVAGLRRRMSALT